LANEAMMKEKHGPLNTTWNTGERNNSSNSLYFRCFWTT